MAGVGTPKARTPRDRALKKVRCLVAQVLGESQAKIYLVGSCARGDARRPSDIDVAVDLPLEAPEWVIPDIRVALDKSDIPFFVDVFDLRRLPRDYRNSLLKDAVEWT